MILENLKKRTEKLHREVEADNLAKYILDHTITRSQYANLLLANFVAYNAIETKAQKNKYLLPTSLMQFADEAKSTALRTDLKQLGIATNPELLTADFEINSLSQLIGMIYVSEGSMMGGMLIARHLDKCENLDSQLEHHFFNGKTKDILNRWKSFTAAVNDAVFTEEEIDKAVETANATFKLFDDAFKTDLDLLPAK